MSDALKQALSPQSMVGQEITEKLKKAVEESASIKTMELEIRNETIKAKHADLQKRKEDKQASEKFSLDTLDTDYFRSLAVSNAEYFYEIKQSATFLNPKFDGYIPYFANNLILLGAQSGHGKSTITANIALDAFLQDKNVLVITNEEVVSDVYNRITCLENGWSYTDHKNLSQEQIKAFNKNYERLGRKIRVIADHHNGRGGLTTTYEGVKSVLESLHKSNVKYDVIIIDYFQNISISLDYPSLEEWKVLDKMAQFLDSFRKSYKAPIVLLSQLKADENSSFKERVERCKSIYNKATCAIEVIALHDQLATSFTIHKSRFSQGIGRSITMGFDRGRYVDRAKQLDQMDEENHKKLVKQ